MTRTLGRYRVLDEIGRGAMGVVYLGHDPFLDRPVALKVPHRDAHVDPDAAALYEALFFNETRAAGRLHHPNIVELYDAGVEGEEYYIAMEYVRDAATLEAFCRPGSLLPLEKAAEVVFKCAQALDYAHREGVIHRDVKPANILLQGGETVKVADFSVALLGGPDGLDTEIPVRAGSPLYMAPEQVREETTTAQSDLFALGVVLYELLTGRHPFSGRTLAAVTHRIVNEEPVPLAKLRPDAPASLAHVLERALAKRTGERYANALELAAELSQTFGALRGRFGGFTAEGRVEVLRRLAFFRDFADAELWELLRWAPWEERATGSVVITQGEAGDSVFVIVDGEVAVCRGSREVAVLGPGECFGEIGYLVRRPRTATVVARTRVALLRFNRDLLERASERCQLQFLRAFIEALVARLVDTTDSLTGDRRQVE